MIERQKLVAAAIANARGARRGAPNIKNILEVLPQKLRDEVMDDARAALTALGIDVDVGRPVPPHGSGPAQVFRK